ncbi:hypothetical protein J7J84_05485 [bacterium]|nr:hypothetical protein [bacterium]
MTEVTSDDRNVYGYTIDKLVELLSRPFSEAYEEIVWKKSHIKYFEGYFDKLDAKTIVVELEYVDKDFIEDYANYYVRCFGSIRDIRAACTRIHFFTGSFNEKDFLTFLHSPEESNDQLLGEYLGFVVVKPLPEAIIGRTCLKTYPREQGRTYPILRLYRPSLHGIQLEVESLAFQEQDTVAAACATTSIWSAFHKTSQEFEHELPTPVRITSRATGSGDRSKRALPSEGLHDAEIARAIRSVGLETHTLQLNSPYLPHRSPDLLKAMAYAYTKGQLPAILCGALVPDNPDIFLQSTLGLVPAQGYHALTITGFRLEGQLESWSDDRLPDHNGLMLTSSRTNKLYVHDDQVGPFARMEFLSPNKRIHLSECDTNSPLAWTQLSSSYYWPTLDCFSLFAPLYAIVPVYHKIRVEFLTILDAITKVDGLLENVRHGTNDYPIASRLEWDVYLTRTHDFKESILARKDLSTECRTKILLRSFPRFMWRCTGKISDESIIDVLFDATSYRRGYFFHHALSYNPHLTTVLQKYVGHKATQNSLLNKVRDPWYVKLIEFIEGEMREELTV